MPKRNRAREQRAAGYTAPAAPVVTEQERAAKLFVDSVKAHDAADRAERERVKAAAERVTRLDELRDAKQSAAERIKRLRGSEGKREQVVEAEAAYRVALAELQEFETGERPHWAPTPSPLATTGSDDPAPEDGGHGNAAASDEGGDG